ncbi:hypothetical protein [Estrella lausannensis]|uniref:Conserved putative membrane protein n=1 Tax=Estrella lausannensis TaxID=483423 RepID=A0A0H5DPA4_9BACT|nr:hypothetical protein [Estrella lausannensis]CRX38356.1 Conserved putative membrane protein [Estrella lausannensis]
MMYPLTLTHTGARWHLDTLVATDSKKETESAKLFQKAVKKLNHAFKMAAGDLQNKVHPMKNDAVYDEVYDAGKLIKKIETAIGKHASAEDKEAVGVLKRCVMSMRLGGSITPEILKANPEFEKFITANHWHHKAYRYEHVLPVIDGEPGVFYEGQGIKFSELMTKNDEENKPLVDPYSKKMPNCCIIKQGIMPWAQHNVKELFAHTQEDPSTWGDQYVYEIVTSLLDKEEKTPHFTGDHCWLRLRTKDGDVYSWGVVRPDITVWQGLKQRSTMMLNGAPECPDGFESLEKKEHHMLATQIPITEEQFEEIKGNLNKMNKNGVPFSVMTGLTCQGHVVHQASKIGVKINSEMTGATFIGKSFFGKTVNWLWKAIVPKVIRVVITYLFDFVLGLTVGRLLSIHAVDPKVRETYGDEFDGFTHNFFNIFKPVMVQHPLAMRKWQRKVEAFRNSDEGRRIGPWAMPEEFLTPKKKEAPQV